jgi:hypothetical protein
MGTRSIGESTAVKCFKKVLGAKGTLPVLPFMFRAFFLFVRRVSSDAITYSQRLQADRDAGQAAVQGYNDTHKTISFA